jgi:tetratricopeptide (TPR) repeat protein
MATAGSGAGRQGRLKSWKEIAAFFGADERTVKRWEGKRGLPVHRIPGGARATVYAEVAELEQWLKGHGQTAPAKAGRPRRKMWLVGAAAAALLAAAGGGALLLRGGAPAPAAHHQPSAEVADLYLQGRYNVERRSPESLNRAVQLFGDAIRRDPLYAEAHAGLASAWLLLREYAGVPDAVAYPRARAAARRALALDGGLADAHAALAFVTFFYDLDFNAGLAEFDRAVTLDPASAGAHHWYATALLHAGRAPEALVQIDRAQRLEPQSQSILADKALILFFAGRAPAALALLRQLEAADPSYLSPHAYLAGIHLDQHDYPAYLREEGIATRLVGDQERIATNAAAARAFAAGGAPAMFAAMIDRQRARYAAGREHPFTLAASYALAGRNDEAMAALTAAARDRDPYMVGLRIDSRLASLRGRPDFERLKLSVGGD